ncbi:MAG: hypothetical protein DME18_01725 [Verrucomicrobia bacterium]|nr:MAG: hypothetical protein DME18_01725 [Verrucomicrobiota bacterium]
MKNALLAIRLITIVPLCASAGVILSDSFSYPDGPLITVSNGKWSTHSGTAGQMDVIAGKINLTQTESEDVNAPLEGQPYGPTSSTNLYARFTVDFSALPSGAGTYFAHFKDTTTSGFRCRIFATTNGAAPGFFRLGISAAANTPATFPNDLSLNTDYVVVVKLSTSDSAGTLWLNPASESDANMVSTDTAAALNVASFAFRQSLSAGNGMGTLTVDDFAVGTSFGDLAGGVGDGPPVITSQPASQTVTEGQGVAFSVGATGAPPLGYQWQFDGADLDGATNAELSLSAVTADKAGTYAVNVSNALGSTNSDPATLTVLARPAAVTTNIAYLHTLLDNVNYLPTDTTTLFQVEGVVTTHTNLTTPGNASFYLQDDSAGIAVFVSGGAAIRPAQGDRVRVTGPLGHFNGLLEMNLAASNPAHKFEAIGSGNPLPAPMPLEFSWQDDPAVIEPHEGSYLVVSNVFLDLSTGGTFTSGSNVTMTNESGETFTLRIDARVTDLIGQPKPTTAVTIYGVLSQFAVSDPRTTGYQLLPSSLSDIVGPRLPTVKFTNTLSHLTRAGDTEVSTNLTEYALRPSETIAIETMTTGVDGRPVTLEPQTNGLPAGASWSFSETTGMSVSASFTFTPGPADEGANYSFVLLAINDQGTNAAAWNIYVPTPDEQRFYLSEFLANPTTDPAAPFYNPLHRDTPGTPDRITAEDEYIELVNLAASDLDLNGWTVSDAATVRHRFFAGDTVQSSNAVVVYGGRLLGSLPNLPVPGFAATESTNGLALNNNGDMIVVRNGSGYIVERVVYSQDMLSTNGSLTRSPDLNSAFVPHSSISTNYVSPGTQPDGRRFSEPAPLPPPVITVSVTAEAGPSVTLHWNADPARTYSVLQADNVSGLFGPLAIGLRFTDTQGEFTDANLSEVATRFYLIATQ